MLKTPQERLRLSRGVGDGLPNRAPDVAALAAALDHFGRYNVKTEAPVSGGSQLVWKLDNALRGFQRSFGLKPDGRVLPGGPTATTLNTLRRRSQGHAPSDEAVFQPKSPAFSREAAVNVKCARSALFALTLGQVSSRKSPG